MYSFHQEWLHTQSFFPAETLPTLPTLDKRDAFLFICTFQIDGYFLSFFFFFAISIFQKKKVLEFPFRDIPLYCCCQSPTFGLDLSLIMHCLCLCTGAVHFIIT